MYNQKKAIKMAIIWSNTQINDLNFLTLNIVKRYQTFTYSKPTDGIIIQILNGFTTSSIFLLIHKLLLSVYMEGNIKR